jgi:hypothetical protein
MESPSISTYVLTVALAGVGGWALSQGLADDAPPAVAAVSAQAPIAAAPQPQAPVILNLTTPATTVAPVLVPQHLPAGGARAPRTSGGGRSASSRTAFGQPPAIGRGGRATASAVAVATSGPAASAPASGFAPMVITASDGSIVYISQSGNLIANTGAVSTSGVLALGVQGSDLASGTSTGSSTVTTAPSAIPGNPMTNQSWQAMGRAGGFDSVAVSGFEDHSVSILGNDQVTTYDDSNVFLFRNGDINANTGDTDSSGLNAVDVWDSRVRAGNSGDGEDVESPEDGEAAEPGSAATPLEGDRTESAPAADEATSESSDDSATTSETGATELGGHGATVTDEGSSTAVGGHSMVVGADGYDDVSIRSQGNGNITTYDDSNVVIGGTGHVNAQIGDSDTGGTVVMGVHGSDVTGGCEGDLCSAGSDS